MRIYFVRHADPDYPNKTITAEGHKQSKALAAWLADQKELVKEAVGEEVKWHLYSSPVERALHTANHLSETLGCPVDQMEWLSELRQRTTCPINGKLIASWDTPGEILRPVEGLDDKTTKERAEYTEKLMKEYQDDYDTVVEHSDKFFESLGFKRQGAGYMYKGDVHDQIVIVSHFGFGVTWLSHMLGIPRNLFWSGVWLAPSSVSTILFEKRSPEIGVPRLLCLGDIAHLYKAKLPLPFNDYEDGKAPAGIKANFY